MTIQVIGAGFGRTGTLSLKQALETLGYRKCYHMTEAMTRPHHAHQWEEAARGNAVDWNKLFEGYQATVDWPGATFYKELMEHYPEARVILTTRDPDAWYESARKTIYLIPGVFPRWVRRYTPVRHHLGLVNNLIWQGMTFNGRFEDRAFALDVYQRHVDEVQRHVPADRLLVFDVSEGWQPLCDFLDLPIPDDRPFPHVNDGAQFRFIVTAGSVASRAFPWLLLALLVSAVYRLVKNSALFT